MKDIKEIILLLAEYKINHFKQADPQKSKMSAFVEGIQKGEYSSDDVAIALLYGGERNAYRKMKSDVRKKLLDSVDAIPGAACKKRGYKATYYECLQNWYRLRVLIAEAAPLSAISLAESLLPEAIKYDFTTICIEILSYLRLQYALRYGNTKKYQETVKQLQYYEAVQQVENRAEAYFAELTALSNQQWNSGDNLESQARFFAEDLAPDLERYKTYKVQLYGRLIAFQVTQLAKNHEEGSACCDDAILFFESLPYTAEAALQIFWYFRLKCDFQLGKFEAGMEAAQKCLSVVKPGTFNWYKSLEMYMLLCIYNEQYVKADALLQEGLRHKRFGSLPDSTREVWRIYDYYFYFLSAVGKLTAVRTDRYKISKLDNETPIYSRDKYGYNVSILVLKILFRMLEGHRGRLLDEVDAIEQYCYRHLRSRPTLRSYHFIKALLTLAQVNFDVDVALDKAARHLNYLKQNPASPGDNDGTEIIPYERLCLMICSYLNRSKPPAVQENYLRKAGIALNQVRHHAG